VVLPRAHVPTSIAQQVIGAWKPLYKEVVVLEEEWFMVVTAKSIAPSPQLYSLFL
jgi:hypothetical protein